MWIKIPEFIYEWVGVLCRYQAGKRRICQSGGKGDVEIQWTPSRQPTTLTTVRKWRHFMCLNGMTLCGFFFCVVLCFSPNRSRDTRKHVTSKIIFAMTEAAAVLVSISIQLEYRISSSRFGTCVSSPGVPSYLLLSHSREEDKVAF